MNSLPILDHGLSLLLALDFLLLDHLDDFFNDALLLFSFFFLGFLGLVLSSGAGCSFVVALSKVPVDVIIFETGVSLFLEDIVIGREVRQDRLLRF